MYKNPLWIYEGNSYGINSDESSELQPFYLFFPLYYSDGMENRYVSKDKHMILF